MIELFTNREDNNDSYMEVSYFTYADMLEIYEAWLREEIKRLCKSYNSDVCRELYSILHNMKGMDCLETEDRTICTMINIREELYRFLQLPILSSRTIAYEQDDVKYYIKKCIYILCAQYEEGVK